MSAVAKSSRFEGYTQIPRTSVLTFSSYRKDPKMNKYDISYFGFVNVTKGTDKTITIEPLHIDNEKSWKDQELGNRIYQIFICAVHFAIQKDGQTKIVLGLRDAFESKILPKGKSLRLEFNGKIFDLGTIDDTIRHDYSPSSGGSFEYAMDVYKSFRDSCKQITIECIDEKNASLIRV